ncbi:hypothetical protein WA158_008203 [Blastocystis sp. Blastoise]
MFFNLSVLLILFFFTQLHANPLVTCSQNYRFPQTISGEIATIPCSGNMEGFITRLCDIDGIWSTPDYSNCIRTVRSGSIAITQRNADGSDTFELLILDEIPSGTDIMITDNAILGTKQFRTGEGMYHKILERTYYPGELLYISNEYPFNPFNFIKVNNFDLSVKGDQLTIFTGSFDYTSINTWIFNLHTPKITQGYDSFCDTICSSTNCYEPYWMPNNTYLWITAPTITRYYGLLSGTRTNFLNSITDRNNWQTTENSFSNIASYDWYTIYTESEDIHCSTEDEWIEIGAHETRVLPCIHVSGIRTRYCNPNGQWNSIDLSLCNQQQTITCPFENEWPATTSNTIITLSCPIPMSGIRTRKCNWNGKWLPVNMSQCNGDLLKGSVAIVQYISLKPNKIVLLTTITLPIHTQIIISDSGYTQNKELLPRENMVAYTISDSPLPAGSLLTYIASNNFLEINSNWRQIRGSSFDFDQDGDNLFVFIGTPSSPYFIYGLTYNNDWQIKGSVLDHTSYLPYELEWNNRICALTIYNNHSKIYNGITIDTQTNLLLSIKNEQNWIYLEDQTINISNNNFTILGKENDLICQQINNIPSSTLGEQYISLCPSGNGTIIYTCIFNNFHAQWNLTSNTCTNLTHPIINIHYPFSNYQLIKSIPFTITPIIQGGNILFWNIYPILPFGFEFNTQTGIITGIPQTNSDSIIYTIIATDIYNIPISISLNISSITGYCQQEDSWPKTEIESIISIPCPNNLYYTGSLQRYCKNINQWDIIIDNCIPNKPTNLSYSYTILNYIKYNTIETLIPNVTGIVTSWTVEPQLPNGLILNSNNGYISGIPYNVTEPSIYTIYARNSVSFESITLTISISSDTCDSIDIWPSKNIGEIIILNCTEGYTGSKSRVCISQGIHAIWSDIIDNCILLQPIISYSQSSYTLLINSSIIPIIPITQNIINNFTINPSLPNGLLFNTQTGIITGIPSLLSSSINYNITASNIYSSITIHLIINIVNSICFSDGIWPDTQINNYSQLPCDNNEDYIGNKTRLCNHISIWEDIIDNCEMISPTNIQYNSENKLILRINMLIIPIIPTYNHIITNWIAITPLPDGLFLDSITGKISGIPSIITNATIYQIKASNIHSNTIFNIIIEILQSICQEEDGYPSTLINQIAIKPCEDIINYEGNKQKICQENNTWSSEINYCIQKAPWDIHYSTNNILLFNRGDIINSIPTFKGIVTNVTVTPNLPNGLSIISNSGIITGIPLIFSSSISYIFKFSNSYQYTFVNISISIQTSYCNKDTIWNQTEKGETAIIPCEDTINYEGSQTRYCTNTNPPQWTIPVNGCILRSPYNIQYPNSNYTWNTNYNINPITPTYSGIVTLWTITPSLPLGLTINPNNGNIYGTPTISISNTAFLITASNSQKSSSYYLQISIITLYCQSQFNLPQLPAGQSATTICENNYQYHGSKTYICSLTKPPIYILQYNNCIMNTPEITYSSNTFIFIKSSLIYMNPPIINGIVTSITISPTLPNGLQLLTSNGVIYGTPTVTSNNTPYIITFSNNDSNTSITLYISVITLNCPTMGIFYSIERGQSLSLSCGNSNEWIGTQSRSCLMQNPPVWGPLINNCLMKTPYSIHYSNQNHIIKQMIPILDIIPSYQGIVTSFSIQPDLPLGLTLNPITGIIYGIPTIYTSYTTYTITLSNDNSHAIYLLGFSVIKNTCSSIDGFPETPVTQTTYIPCNGNKKGIMLRTCIYINSLPTWDTIDTSLCTIYEGYDIPPPSGYTYLRIKGIFGISPQQFTNQKQYYLQYSIYDILFDLNIKLSDIVIESIQDISYKYSNKVTSEVIIRITCLLEQVEIVKSRLIVIQQTNQLTNTLIHYDQSFNYIDIDIDNSSTSILL